MSVFLCYNFSGDNMKKVLFLLIIILFIGGCGNKDLSEKKEEEVITVNKLDNSKDYIYFDTYKKYDMGDLDIYKLDIPVINIDNSYISSINLEIKSFILNSVSVFILDNNTFIGGKYITYEYYISNKYASLLIKHNNYSNGVMDSDNYIIYNIDLSKGNSVNNKELLKSFLIDENELPLILRNKLESEDVEYSILCMKNEYYLYVDNDNKLHLLFFEIDDENKIKKDLIIN